MNRAEAFPSKYLNVKGLRCFQNGERIWTIRDVRKETVESQDGTATLKNIMYFVEPESTPLVINGTNWDVLSDAWRDESDLWIGKKVQLYIDPNARNPSGGPPGGVRIKIPAGSVVNLPGSSAPVPGAEGTTPIVPAPNLNVLLEEAKIVGMAYKDVIDMLHQEGYTVYSAQTAPAITRIVRDFIANYVASKNSNPNDAAGESVPF